MSIYCSFGGIDDERDRPRSRKKPIRYQGSHVLPSNKDERRGRLSLAYIPPHVRRGKRRRAEDAPFWPWLRIGVVEGEIEFGGTVILTYAQVKKLRDDLDWWLASAAQPTDGGKEQP